MMSDKELIEINKQIKKIETNDNINKIKEDILMIPISDFTINKLLGFQVHHVQNLIFAININGISTDQSDAGTGKTKSAIAVCKELELKPFIIGPKSVISQWYRACCDFEIEPLGAVNYETIKNGKYYKDLSNFQDEAREECPYIEIIKINKINFITKQNILNKNGNSIKIIHKIIWKLPPNTLVIFDEVHKGKNGVNSMKTSVNSQLIVSIKPYLKKEQRIFGLFLSATITDKIENLDVLLYLLGFYRPYLQKSFTSFIKTLGTEREIILKKIHNMIFPFKGSRMRINKLPLGIFKKNDIQAKLYPVSDEIVQSIEEQHLEIQRSLTTIRNKGESQGLGKIIYCWQKIEIIKSFIAVQETLNYLKEHLSVVIFVNFNETRKLIAEKLLKDSSIGQLMNYEQIDYIHGKQTSEERDKIVQKFQNDEIFVLICNIKAGGVGISLHDINGVRQRVSLIFPTWSPIDLKQSIGRIYRANSKSDAIQRIIYCKSKKENESDEIKESYITIEEKICANLNEKLENIEFLNDSDLTNLIKI